MKVTAKVASVQAEHNSMAGLQYIPLLVSGYDSQELIWQASRYKKHEPEFSTHLDSRNFTYFHCVQHHILYCQKLDVLREARCDSM